MSSNKFESASHIVPDEKSGLLPGYGKKVKLGTAILFGLIAILYFTSLTSEPDINSDACSFLLLAESLASGNGYRSVDLVCAPPHFHFPCGFPVLLTPLVYFFGFNVLILKGFVTFLALCSFSCLALLLMRFKPEHTVPVLLLTMVSPWIFRFSHLIMSEIPYLLYSLLAVYFVLRYKEQTGWLNRQGVLTVLFLVLATLTRSIGISLAAATVCALLFGVERTPVRFKKTAFAIIGFSISIFACRIMLHGNAHTTGGSYIAELFIDPYDIVSGTMNFPNLFQRLAHNFYALIMYGIPNNLAGMQFKGRTVISVVMAAFAVLGFAAAFKKRSIIEWYMTGYILILLLWPWTRTYGTRFLIPVVPFIFYYFLTGVTATANLFPRVRSAKALYPLLFALLFISNAMFSFRFITGECRKDWSGKLSGNYIEMTKRVNEIAPADASFITWNTAIFYVWSHRKSLCVPYIRTVNELEKIMKKNPGSYIIDMPYVYDPDAVQSAAREHPEWFSELFNKGGVKVYKIR